MTSFSVQSIPYSSSITPLFSQEKGTMGNRIDCAAAQTLNTAKGTIKMGLAGGAAYGVYHLAKKSSKFANVTFNALKYVQNMMNKNKYAAKVTSFIANAVKGLPKSGKIGVIAALIAAPVVAYSGAKQLYQMGQIDQKYTDRAGMQTVV